MIQLVLMAPKQQTQLISNAKYTIEVSTRDAIVFSPTGIRTRTLGKTVPFRNFLLVPLIVNRAVSVYIKE